MIHYRGFDFTRVHFSRNADVTTRKFSYSLKICPSPSSNVPRSAFAACYLKGRFSSRFHEGKIEETPNQKWHLGSILKNTPLGDKIMDIYIEYRLFLFAFSISRILGLYSQRETGFFHQLTYYIFANSFTLFSTYRCN